MRAPLVLFAYNRPAHVARALKSLSVCEQASETALYVYCDGARGSDDASAVAAVRREVGRASGFASVRVVEREGNVGLARNVIEGVGEVIREHGVAIVVEDDLEFSASFLKYMNAALTFYAGRGVFSISGYSPEVVIPHDYASSTYVMHRNGSWGWATWREKWESVDWEVGDFDRFIRSGSRRKSFNECGNDLSPMLLRWKTGEISSWSIRFCYAGFVAGEPTVYPRRSLVRNCGADGSGTNMGQTERYEVPLAPHVSTSHFAEGVATDPRIVESFRTFYDTSSYRQFVNGLKRLRYILFGK